MKKAIYIIFTVVVLILSVIIAVELVENYSNHTMHEINSNVTGDEKDAKANASNINISNSNGSYMILYNPSGIKDQADAKDTDESDQKSILVTVPFNLEGARYWVLDDYYTRIDYNLATHEDGNTVTEINLYNVKRQERYTLNFSTTGKALESNDKAKNSKIDPSSIPSEEIQVTPSKGPNDNKVTLSKGTSYIEIPEYFKVVNAGFDYSPEDFIQFTNIYKE